MPMWGNRYPAPGVAHIVGAKIFDALKNLIVKRRAAHGHRRGAEQERRLGPQDADRAVPLNLNFDGLFLGAKIGET